jgi:hypothetical protein
MTHIIFEFIKENYFLVFYAVALVLSIIRYSRYFDSLLRYFPIIIAYTLISEILGFLIKEYEDIQIVYLEGYSFYNLLIFNIFDIVFFLYFFYVYRNVAIEIKFKNWIKYGAILFIICSVLNPFFQDFILYPQLIGSTVGSVILIISIILYFLDKKTIIYVPIYRNLLFWISMGLLIFYTFYPFILLIGYFHYELYLNLRIRQVHHILIAIMYLSFIFGFIFMRRIRPAEKDI